MLNKKKNNKGFTLVELLVVIAIIGILAVVAVPALFNNIQKARISELESDISAIKSAAATSYADTGAYPTDGNSPKTTVGTNTSTDAFAGLIDDLGKPLGASYVLSGASATPSDLVLSITTTSKINAAGIEKLKSDFGNLTNAEVGTADGTTAKPIKIVLIDYNQNGIDK
ncbi:MULTISPECIES: type II secretion system protein [unclassified Romboutsia]|uniref:type II secretion system protein n=1 Tax=unclassified Romboutsia TaxID=2626894 RepID=UPI0008213D23|nr:MULTISPECIES: prepilin-type N-terminal cleavage/methylation domain-containing protein [unclassified Romboutsia]SCI38302.1 Pilin [uncultured Clostridium sp.]